MILNMPSGYTAESIKRFDPVINFIRQQYNEPDGSIFLHEPSFKGNDIAYVTDAIKSTFVSSVGEYVDRFEEMLKEYTGAKYAVACVNGTAALHIALLVAGVKKDDLVITQPLTFVATCNAIDYLGAAPLFVDVDKTSLGLSADKLESFFNAETVIRNGQCFHKLSGKRIAACLPMHTFGHPCNIDKIAMLCAENQVPLVEDAAEAVGSFYHGKHAGTFGLLGTLSFNGNKTITCGGGGAILTDDEKLGKLAKHLTTQAKKSHKWEYDHDYIGYNYRLPNLNAALACAQLEQLENKIAAKRKLANDYKDFFKALPFEFIEEPKNTRSNYWLNAILLKDKAERDAFLSYTHEHKIYTRPIWNLITKNEFFRDSIREDISIAEWLEERIVNLPSSDIHFKGSL